MKILVKLSKWLLLFCWLGVIFWFSSQPDLKSELPNFFDFIFRKIAHITEYYVLTYLFFINFKEYLKRLNRLIAWSAIFAILVACIDEFNQMFVSGRSGSIIDVFIDIIGIFVALSLLLFYNRGLNNIY